MVFSGCLKPKTIRMISEVRQHIVPASGVQPSCIECSVAEDGARRTDEKRASVSRAQSSAVAAGVGNEAAVVSQATRSMVTG